MNYGSTFTGIGGFDLAADRAGFRCSWQAEKDAACTMILERHWPDTERFDDVLKLRALIERRNGPLRPDLICGGFPCQDLSVAGRRAGLAGTRSGLWFVFRRIVAKLRPEWVLIENVPGLLSSNGGRDMGTIVGGLGRMGYGWSYRCLDSQWFGLAQRRKRVFIVGCFGSVRRAAQVLFEPDCLPWDSAPSRQTGTRVAAGLTRGAESSGRGGYAGRRREDDVNLAVACADIASIDATNNVDRGDSQHDGRLVAYQCHGSNVGPMGAIRAGNGNETGGVPFVPYISPRITRNQSGRSSNQVGIKSDGLSDCLGQDGPGAVAFMADDYKDGSFEETDLARPLTTSADRTRAAPVAFQSSQSGVRQVDKAPTLDSNNGSRRHNGIASMSGVRRLTPVECARLQGFPDDWLDGLSDSAAYRCLGNAVSVPVALWIARRILESR